jgi:hypothetical protein
MRLLAIAIMALFVCAQGVRAESGQFIGVGANYWTSLRNIDVHNIDKDGFSWQATYQCQPARLLKVEADLEMFKKGFEGIDTAVYAPEGYLIIGSTIYAAAGVGILYADGDFNNKPFYALRAGLDLKLLSQLYADLNVNYRFAEWTSLSAMSHDINADTMTLGAALRLKF